MTDLTPIFHEPGAPNWASHWTRPRAITRNIYAPSAPATCADMECAGQSGYLNTAYCKPCAWKVWALLESNMDPEMAAAARDGYAHHLADERFKRGLQQAAMTPEASRRQAPGVIYYIRMGDLVKIGYTADLRQRVRAYPPHAELLAAHPGTLETERQIHHKFLMHLSKGREWFESHDVLTAHIEEVCENFDQSKYRLVA